MFIRVRENGQWSQWYLTDKDGGAGKDRADGTQARGGTDPFITAGADGIQIRVTGDEDDLPADLEVAMIPDNPQGETTLAEDDVVTTAAEGTDLNLESVQAEGNDFTSLIQPEQNTEADSQSAEPEAEIPTPASSEDSAEESTQTVYPGVGSGIAIGRSGAQLSRAFPKTAQPNGLPIAVTRRPDGAQTSPILTGIPSTITPAMLSFITRPVPITTRWINLHPLSGESITTMQ